MYIPYGLGTVVVGAFAITLGAGVLRVAVSGLDVAGGGTVIRYTPGIISAV
jgi:hypothetical protein